MNTKSTTEKILDQHQTEFGFLPILWRPAEYTVHKHGVDRASYEIIRKFHESVHSYKREINIPNETVWQLTFDLWQAIYENPGITAADLLDLVEGLDRQKLVVLVDMVSGGLIYIDKRGANTYDYLIYANKIGPRDYPSIARVIRAKIEIELKQSPGLYCVDLPNWPVHEYLGPPGSIPPIR